MKPIICKKAVVINGKGKQAFALDVALRSETFKTSHITYYPEQRMLMVRDFNNKMLFIVGDMEIEPKDVTKPHLGDAYNFPLD